MASSPNVDNNLLPDGEYTVTTIHGPVKPRKIVIKNKDIQVNGFSFMQSFFFRVNRLYESES